MRRLIRVLDLPEGTRAGAARHRSARTQRLSRPRSLDLGPVCAAVGRPLNRAAHSGVADRRVAKDDVRSNRCGLAIVGRVWVPARATVAGLHRLAGRVELDPSRRRHERGRALGSRHGRDIRPGRTAVRREEDISLQLSVASRLEENHRPRTPAGDREERPRLRLSSPADLKVASMPTTSGRRPRCDRSLAHFLGHMP